MKKITVLIARLLTARYLHTGIWLVNVWFTDPVHAHGTRIIRHPRFRRE